jgi:hypothetical protein
MTTSDAPRGRAFWIGLSVGSALSLFGLGGLLRTTSLASTFNVGTWVVGADLANDLVLLPAAVLISLLLARAIPLRWRVPIRSALIATAVLTIIAYPALRGFGHDTAPGNSSVQPLDYTTALATTMAVVWGAAGIWLLAIAWRRRHHECPPSHLPRHHGRSATR